MQWDAIPLPGQQCGKVAAFFIYTRVQGASTQPHTFEHPERCLNGHTAGYVQQGSPYHFPKILCGCIQEGYVHSCSLPPATGKTELLCQNEHSLQGTRGGCYFRASAKRRTDFDIVHISSNRRGALASPSSSARPC